MNKGGKVSSSFDPIAAEWNKKTGNGEKGGSKHTVQAVFDLLGKLKRKTIYDVACGNGFLARKFLERGAKEVWATDVSPRLITIAKEKYSSEGIRYSVREATDFRGIPKSYFDAVVIHQGIFYIKNIDALAKGIAKILKPGGLFIFTLLHPLFSSARQDAGDDVDAVDVQKEYLKVYAKVVSRSWGKDQVSYLTYKRPISYYINMCARNGLLIDSMIEPKTIFQREGTVLHSNIPASMIMRAAKM